MTTVLGQRCADCALGLGRKCDRHAAESFGQSRGFDDGVKAGEALAEARIVAWLRDTTHRRRQFRYPLVKDISDCCRHIADAIEKGETRRG